MSGIYIEYRQRLAALAEPTYRDFSASLIPNADNILGVRIPAVRKLAMQLAKDDWQTYFNENEDVYFEETLLEALTIGFLQEIDLVLAETKRFIPKITNWAICDSFCGGLKITKAHREQVWNFLMDYIASDKPYYIRFAVVMMLGYFIDEAHTIKMLQLLDGVRHEDYYVKMAVAWAISMCYVNQPEKTLAYLRDNSLDDFTYNKSLQKICESLKPSVEEKALIRSMKRKKQTVT